MPRSKFLSYKSDIHFHSYACRLLYGNSMFTENVKEQHQSQNLLKALLESISILYLASLKRRHRMFILSDEFQALKQCKITGLFQMNS